MSEQDTTTTAEPQDTTAATAAGGADAGDGGQQDSKTGQTFSQAELDRVVADRLARERAKFKDYGDLKSKAAEHDKAVEAQKTAEQRAQDEAERYKKRAEGMMARLAQASIKAQAAAKDFADADDASGFLPAGDFVSSDGEVDSAAIDAALDDLLSRKPHLRKPEPGPRPPAPTRAQGSSGTGPSDVDVAPGMARLRHAYSTSTTTK